VHRDVAENIKRQKVSNFVRVVVDSGVDDTTQLSYHVDDQRDWLWQHAQHTFINDTFINHVWQVT